MKSKDGSIKYNFRGQIVSFGQPNQKGQGQNKEQWIDSRMGIGKSSGDLPVVDVFAGVTATDAEKREALSEVWELLAKEKASTSTEVAKPADKAKK